MDKSSYGRKDRLMQEREHDVYHSRAKLPDPTRCSQCGVVYAKGRWVWADAPEGASLTVCPACRRIADRFPAGQIEMRGSFFAGHREEILNLVRNVEGREKANHPMERIMAIEELPEGAGITTTGIHLARGIGSALSSAYAGELSVRYLDGENFVKISWVR
ncbi:MAG: ATPase [Kiritimatiellales bacterium]|nr:ATPase [Kiritimatiellales bacterium]